MKQTKIDIIRELINQKTELSVFIKVNTDNF